MDDQQTTGQDAGQETADSTAVITAEVSNAWETLDKMIDGFFAVLPKLVIASVVFVLFIALAWIIKLLVLRATKHHASAHIGRVLARLSQWSIYIIGMMVAVAIVAPSVTPAKLIAALGVGSVAIGFAFKDVLQNFLAGILILLRQPFKVGDAVKFGDHEGYVEEIDTRLTIIKTYDGRQVLVPNGEIYTNPITVLTAYDKRRSQYDVGIGYGDDIGEACEAALAAMQATEGVLSDPPPDVIVSDLASSTVNIRARWWSAADQVLSVKSRVMQAIKEALDEAQIDMPYPTQVSLFHDQTEETDGNRAKQREGWPKGKNPPRSRAEALQAGSGNHEGQENGRDLARSS